MPSFHTKREVVKASRVMLHAFNEEAASEAQPGDWIVHFPDGCCAVFSDEVFRMQYEPVPGDDEAVRHWEVNRGG